MSSANAATKQLGGAAPLVLAHRGASGYLPEHTLAGYELAVKLGADYIEPDLQLTKDGVLVAMHDDTLTRTTNVQTVFAGRPSYAVSDFTLAEIKSLTVKPVGTASTTYPGFTPVSPDPLRIPTFQEVIDLARSLTASTGREIGIYPEAKQADPVDGEQDSPDPDRNGYTVPTRSSSSRSRSTPSRASREAGAARRRLRLVVLSSSSTALVNYGLPTSELRRRRRRRDHRRGMTETSSTSRHDARLLVARLTPSADRPGCGCRVPEVLRLGSGRRLLELHRPSVAARGTFLAAAVPEPEHGRCWRSGLPGYGVAARVVAGATGRAQSLALGSVAAA